MLTARAKRRDVGRALAGELSPDVVLLGIVFVLGAGLSLLVARSSVLADPLANAIARALLATSFGAAGFVVRRQHRGDRFGAILIGISWLYALTGLLAFRDPGLFSAGRVTWAFMTAALTYAFLAYPTGYLRGRAAKGIAAGAALGTVAVWIPLALGARQLPVGSVLARCAHACPPNAFRVFNLGGTETALARTASLIAGVALLAAAVEGALHAHRLSVLQRRTFVLPVASLVWAALATLVSIAMRLNGGDTPAALAVGWLSIPAFLAFPYAMLLGQARGRLRAESRMRRATAQVARHEPHAELRQMLAEALDDPSLEVRFVGPGDSCVDETGRPLRVTDARSVTKIVRDGRTFAVIAHDPALDETPELVEAVGDAALLVLDNVRLEGELRGAADELRRSRARLTAATEAERRRLEQDLHDSAQQRLVALRIRLGLAEDQAGELSEDMRDMLAQLGHETEEAIESVRSVAQGLYPPLLSGGGLTRALTAEARRMPVQVHVAADTIARSSAETEAAVYFCCTEALQNAAKHAGPDVRITIELHGQNGDLAFGVRDDGGGFDAAATTGTGLTHMRDRIGSVGGTLKIASTRGEGTTVAGTVPWAHADEPPLDQRARALR